MKNVLRRIKKSVKRIPSLWLTFNIFKSIILFALAIPAVMAIRLIAPLILVRVGWLPSTRLGHFAANTELYFLETDEIKSTKKIRIKDFVYLIKPVCNQQLEKMWRRTRRATILPPIFLESVCRINSFIPGNLRHTAGLTKQSDRDVSGLLTKYPTTLQFTQEEKEFGESLLRKLGVRKGQQFVCLNVRDSAYLSEKFPSFDFSYHDYRDSNVEDYLLAAEALADRGIYVLRMGAFVKESLRSENNMIIDYARSGLRSEFADIYLGAHCFFCISCGTGFDAVPSIFRRPILYVNNVPIEYFSTFGINNLGIFKHHHDAEDGTEFPFNKIFECGAGKSLTSDAFRERHIRLVDNSPQEIMEASIEMLDRLQGRFLESLEDLELQTKFWTVFPVNGLSDYDGRPLHGEIKARVSSTYLRSNRSLLGL